MAEPNPFRFDSEQRSVGAAGGRRRVAWPWIALSLALHGAIVLFALMGAARGGHTALLGTLEVAIVGAPSAGDPDSRSAEGEADARPARAEVPRPQAPPEAPSEAAPVPPLPPMPQPATLTPNTPPPEMPKEPAKPDTAVPPEPAARPREAKLAAAAPSAPRASDSAPKRPELARPPEAPAPRKIENAAKTPAEPRLEETKRLPAPPPVPRAMAQAAALPRARAARPAAPTAKTAPSAKAAQRAGVKQAPKGQTASLGAPTGGDRLGRSDTDDTAGLLNVNLNPRFRRPPAPPVYPRQSIERDEEGVVLVRALVGPAGAPQRVIVHKGSGFPLLDEAALKAVSGWRFEPMVRNGRAVAAWVQVPVRFRLN